MAEKKGLRKKKKNNQKESDSVENETLETNSEEEKSLDCVKVRNKQKANDFIKRERNYESFNANCPIWQEDTQHIRR